MKPFFLCAVLLPCLILEGWGDETRPFRFIQPLEGEFREKSIGRVSLDREVYAGTLSSFADLRLVHDEIEIPFLISAREHRGATPAEKIDTSLLDFEKSGSGHLVMEFRLESEKQADYLEFRTGLRDFEKNVRIEGSRDRESWEVLVGEALIFDYARFIDFRKVRVDLPENSCRHFRVTIEEATDRQRSLVSSLTRQVSESSGITVQQTGNVTRRDFRIDEISFFTEEKEEAKEDLSLRRDSLDFSASPEPGDPKHSAFLIEAGQLPLTGLLLETEEVNFRRTVEVQVPVDGREGGWKTIHRSDVFRYEIEDFQSERLEIPLGGNHGGVRQERLRLVIHQGDNCPVEPDAILGESRIHDLYFLSPGSGELKLLFGSGGGSVERPSYDTAAIRMALRKKMAFTEFTGGEVVANPEFSEVAEPFSWTDQRWILWVAIVLVVACLTWILVGSARQMEEANFDK